MSFDILLNVAIFAVALFLMVRFGFGYHFVGGAHRRAHAVAHNGPAGGTPVVDRGVDPVCGMTVDTSVAVGSTFADNRYYFCSDSCRRKFEARPAAYASAVIAPQKAHGHGCCG